MNKVHALVKEHGLTGVIDFDLLTEQNL